MTDGLRHVSVLGEEAVEWLRPRPGGLYVDGTVGGGGHSFRLLSRIGPGGRLIAIDKDGAALERARARLEAFGEAVTFVRDDFRRLADVLARLGVEAVDGVLLDIGVSSFQLDDARRGFAYSHDAPLDMRMDGRDGPTAADLINTMPRDELVRILRTYGEERHAARIARAIVEEREREPLLTTTRLAEVVKGAIPAAARRTGPHPARRTFQALRIAVNDELGALEEGLRAAVAALKPGGRVAVISFHSLEDRIVKQMFAELADPCRCPPDLPVCRCGRRPVIQILTRRPVVPGEDEVAANPRARSAKLRVAERTVLAGEEGE